MPGTFDDLLAANARYATSAPHGFDGIAHAGVLIVTCMDSRLQPLEMVGLFLGEAKILRTPGGHVTPDALAGCILGAYKLNVDRIMVIGHTRCAMTAGTDAEIVDSVRKDSGVDLAPYGPFDSDPDWEGRLRFDVELLRNHPALSERVSVGGFRYDVDNGLLVEVC